jgi:fibronectin-binding autotransporter adhesin
VISSGGTELVGGTASGVTFADTSGVLELYQPSNLSGTLSGWQIGDTIDFVGTSVTSASISGATLSVTVSGGATFTYQLAGQETYTIPTVQSDGNGGTDVVLVAGVPGGQTLEVFSGQTSNGIIVLSGGTLKVDSGGTAINTVDSGGTDLVYGIASGTIVNSGGTETVESGGTASNTVVSSGGSLVVLSSGLADPVVIYAGGSETINSGGSDDGAQISGGVQYDYGLATSVTIADGQ